MKSTLIVATVLAGALTSASAFPAFATKNVGSHINSSEFNQAGELCSFYAAEFSAAVKEMNAAKTKEARAQARDTANWAINRGYGCAWLDAV